MAIDNREGSATETESVLIGRVQAGDVEAFETLFARYSTKIYRQAMHLLGSEAEAEEIVQEVFLTLYEKADSFRGDAALSTWLYRLTANAAISRLRRRARRPEVSLDDHLPQFLADGHHAEPPGRHWPNDIEEALVQAEHRHLLRQAIDELRPLDKAVVILSDLEELSNRETGDILGLSVAAVKSRLHRARLVLRSRLAASLGSASR